MIYTASKTRHAPLWQHLRAVGWPITSTWIDEAGTGQTSDFNNLWERCLKESAECEVFLLYREDEDVLKGAWIELGAALTGRCQRILGVGIQDFTIAKYNRVEHFPTVMDALFTTPYNQ